MKKLLTFENHLAHSQEEYFTRREGAIKAGEDWDPIGVAQDMENRHKVPVKDHQFDLENAIVMALAKYTEADGDPDKAKKIAIDTINAWL
jgi:hypothetical protein